jgi:hypothetical protein
MNANHLNRRNFVQLAAASGIGWGASGWLPRFAAALAGNPERKRSCILLWMSGGPSQTDTFDPKPGHANGGPFQTIATATPGLRIGEHLPLIAKETKHLAVIRSMSTKEGDHGRATQHVRSGNLPQGPIEFPTIGSLIAKEREESAGDLPGYVSIGSGFLGSSGLSPGFLGPQYAPLIVGGAGEGDAEAALSVQNLGLPARITAERAQTRFDMLREMELEFQAMRPGPAGRSHLSAYERAGRLMRGSAAEAFELDKEKPELRDRYGRNRFGQGCLLARRLVERNVPFVEVVLGGWDTHDDNFRKVKTLCNTLDRGWATLVGDLRDRGLLDSTLIVWMGEFGRTPAINPRQGRDHYPSAWSVALGGGGIKGTSVLGRTSASGMGVEERPVAVADLLSTICLALGIDPLKQNMSNVNRPIRIVDQSARPLREILA